MAASLAMTIFPAPIGDAAREMGPTGRVGVWEHAGDGRMMYAAFTVAETAEVLATLDAQGYNVRAIFAPPAAP